MEIALSVVALSGLYAAIQKKNNTASATENFESGPADYSESEPLGDELIINADDNMKSSSEDYYNGTKLDEMRKKKRAAKHKTYSLTGDLIDESQFKHNNMQPFFGSKVRGYTSDVDMAENIFDYKTGNGSQHIKKREQTSLFRPEENLNYQHGAPNTSDFMQSRITPGQYMSNIKPFESERIAPGLGMGYTTTGDVGLNSGLSQREKWQPSTVDDMRVKTNPKVSYSLDKHQGPAMSHVKNIGIEGATEKNRPDTFYENGPDRWLQTTGAHSKQAVRSIIDLPDSNRVNTSQFYQGGAGTTSAKAFTYTGGDYRESTRNEYESPNLPAAAAIGQNVAREGDYGVNGYSGYLTNRNTDSEGNIFGNLGGIIGAAIAPLTDILRPTRTGNLNSNGLEYGEMRGEVPSTYVVNEHDSMRTTNREMYSKSSGHYNVQRQGDNVGGYVIANPVAVAGNRQETSRQYTGNAGFSTSGIQSYDAAYAAGSNPDKEKTIMGRAPNGNTNVFGNNMNTSLTVGKLDNDRINKRSMAPSGAQYIPSIETHGSIDTSVYDLNDQLNRDVNQSRLDPKILDAFKSNPYTHSLTSCV